MLSQTTTQTVAIAALYVALVALLWVGYIVSDDSIYLSYAIQWLDGDFETPQTHWGFRFTIIAPLAGAVHFLGDHEAALAAVAISFGAALVTCVYRLVRKLVSPIAAAVATGLVATTPTIVVSSSILNVDLPEALLGLCSIGMFVFATQVERPAKHLFVSGILLGLAFLTRETASGLMLAYGVLFLAGAFFERKLYLFGALGFLVIFCAEMLYYVTLLGEGPFLRFETAAQSHGSLQLPTNISSSDIGNVSTDWFFGPFLALLVNQEFGLLFYLVVPASWFLLKDKELPDACQVFVRVLLVVIVVWFLWTSYNGALPPLPRYYTIAAVLAAILIGLWLCRMRDKRLAIVIGAILVSTNLASMSLENTHPRFPSRTLAIHLEDVSEPVYTDHLTFTRTNTYLRQSPEVVREALLSGPPSPGSLYFFNPNIGEENREEDDLATRAWDSQNSEVLQTWAPPKRLIGHIVTILHVDGLLPASIRDRLIYCGGPPQLLRYKPQNNMKADSPL